MPRLLMKLREHPSISYRGQRSWPPVWRRIFGERVTPPAGEFGTLTNARPSAVDDHRCFLVIEHGATRYTTCLWFDDKEFCRGLLDLLKKHSGEPIDQIAELEIP